jgi:hypothetical protein
MYNNNIGNLVIKLNFPNNVYWLDNILYIDYPITLYQFIYGININNWIPYSQGLLINISENIIIKLYLNYHHTLENHDILKKLFNQID